MVGNENWFPRLIPTGAVQRSMRTGVQAMVMEALVPTVAGLGPLGCSRPPFLCHPLLQDGLSILIGSIH